MECGPGQEEQDENVEIGISDRERERTGMPKVTAVDDDCSWCWSKFGIEG